MCVSGSGAESHHFSRLQNETLAYYLFYHLKSLPDEESHRIEFPLQADEDNSERRLKSAHCACYYRKRSGGAVDGTLIAEFGGRVLQLTYNGVSIFAGSRI